MGMLLMFKEGRNLGIESIPDQPLEPSFPIVDPNNNANDGWFFCRRHIGFCLTRWPHI